MYFKFFFENFLSMALKINWSSIFQLFFSSPKALPTPDKKKEDDDSYTWGRRLRKKTWKFLEEPDTSLAAKTFSVSSILFILLSTISFCIETLPKYDDSFIWNQTAQKWQFNHTTFHLQLRALLSLLY